MLILYVSRDTPSTQHAQGACIRKTKMATLFTVWGCRCDNPK